MLDKIMHKGNEFYPDFKDYRIKNENKSVDIYTFYVSKGNIRAKHAIYVSGDQINSDYKVPISSITRYSNRICGSVKADGELYYLTSYGAGEDYTSFYAVKASDVAIYKNGGVLSRLLSHLYQCFSSLSRKWVRAC